MSHPHEAAGELDLRKAYDEADRVVRTRGLIAACIIGFVCVPSGVILDYFLYPEQVWTFLAIRLGVDVVLAAIAAALYLGKSGRRQLTVKMLGVSTGLVFNVAFCLMIYLTEGAESPYVMAVNLIITGMTVLLPWTVLETSLMCGLSLAFYVLASIANPAFSSASVPMLGYNVFFILITTVVCVSITYFMSKGRYDEFRLKHQLDVQNRQLQDLDRLKTQFFSNVSHELRTPLTLILGPVETLLGKSEKLEDSVHESLVLVHRNTLRLLKLINDLLDLTRLDQGAEVLRKKSIELASFVRGIVDSVRHLGLSKQLRIRVEDGDPRCTMVADPARLEKVLVNLLTNAIKYTPSGGQITVRWGGDGKESMVEVQDTGVGIPPEDLPKIFDRFHQVRSNASNQSQGVGIGLALAKELVEEHGGTLAVQSEPGKGTTFRAVLPATLDEADEASVETVSEVAGTEEPFEKAFRSADRTWRSTVEVTEEALPEVGRGDDVILVADDEADMRRYVVSLLSDSYRVVQTTHGRNVADLVAEHEPGVVLLDWMMPGKDGLTVCQELRANEKNRDLKILMLTARVDEKSKLDALKCGADDFLTKPFSSVEVKTRVENLLKSARLQQDLSRRNEELTATLEKLQRTESMLIQSEKMNAIGSLSAGLLHEINNPLNYTLTAISFASQFKDTLSEEMKEILADVQEGMTRIKDVVTHLKEFAYPEKAGTESDVFLADVFGSARKIMSKELEGIEIHADIPEDLVLRGQKTQMIHLFLNLLSNAGKAFAAKNQGPKIISVSARVNGEGTVIEFADNGPGIPQEILHRVFEPFFTTREVGSGMGMGLSICHSIVEAHRGSIRVGNRDAGGAIFTINLPPAREALNLC